MPEHAASPTDPKDAQIAALVASAEEAAEQLTGKIALFDQATLELDVRTMIASRPAIEQAWANLDAMSRLALQLCAELPGVRTAVQAARVRHLRSRAIRAVIGPRGGAVDVAACIAARLGRRLELIAQACAILQLPASLRDAREARLLEEIDELLERELVRVAFRRRAGEVR